MRRARCEHCGESFGGTGLTGASVVGMVAVIALALLGLRNLLKFYIAAAPGQNSIFSPVALGTAAFLMLCGVVPVFYAAWALGIYSREPDAPGAPGAEPERPAPPKGTAFEIGNEAKKKVVGRRTVVYKELLGERAYYLIPTQGDQRGQPVRIRTDVFVVGSHAECHWSCRDLAEIHCVFLTRPHDISVRDLNCGQPVYVDGEVLVPGATVPLRSGASITLGSLPLRLFLRESELPKRELEEWALRRVNEDESGMDDVFKAQMTLASLAAQELVDHFNVLNNKSSSTARLHVKREGDVTVIRFNVREIVDEAEIELMRKEVKRYIEHPTPRVLLHLREVKRLSLEGGYMMIDVARQFRHLGSRVALCRVSPPVENVLDQLRAMNVPFFGSSEEALSKERW